MQSTTHSPSSTTSAPHPTHLEPSELGTKEYWDAHYADDLHHHHHHHHHQQSDDGSASAPHPPSPSDLASWFDDVDAPARTLAFLTNSTFPLSPNYVAHSLAADSNPPASILDLGTGNGSTLFQLHLKGNFTGRMLGVDYSPQSIQLARTLTQRYACADIEFEVLDLIHSDPAAQPWWPSGAGGGAGGGGEGGEGGGFDLVLDKGTFDAISLSPETMTSSRDGKQRRVCEVYPAKVARMVKRGGFLLVTSCNWTEDEVVHWFTDSEGTATVKALEVWDKVKYPKYKFGGREGQGVASVCFRRVR